MGDGSQDEVDEALRKLFNAYDLDESGVLSRDEFLAIEMRLAFESGEVYKGDAGQARMTLADADSSGTLDFEEFRERFLTSYTEQGMGRMDIIEHATRQTKTALTERARMGPRYHAGIRQVLRQIFDLFDASGDGNLSPEEWISAQKLVAGEVSDTLDAGWVDEDGFAAADTNGDGVLDLEEFLEASFTMFEGVSTRADVILGTLQRCAKVLIAARNEGRKETPPISIFVQASQRPEFQPPHIAWQDEGTMDDPEKNASKWVRTNEVAIPLNVATAEDVAALVRMVLKLPVDTWLSMYYIGRCEKEGPRPVQHVRGAKPGEGNISAMLQYFTKPNADLRLYIKNQRKRPSKLSRQPRAFLEERDQLLARRVGQCWGLDWETQLVGMGNLLPPRPLTIKTGDALVIEVPQTSDGGDYAYATSVFMDATEVLSKPVDENIEPKKSKKKKKKSAGEEDALMQLTFVGLQPGKCTLFADMSWEDQEEKLAVTKRITMPCHENSVARIGPIEVEVVEAKSAAKGEQGTFVWWNGEKWSNKKGPAKKKGKKK